MRGIEQLMSSARDDWCTPDCVLDRVRRLGTIALDPCADATRQFAVINLTERGLDRSWAPPIMDEESPIPAWAEGLVYVNPPYGRVIGDWVAKCAVDAARGAEEVGLFPSRTDTQWFDIIWQTAKAVCFWRGRLTFVGADSAAPFPSVVAYWGPRVNLFAQVFESAGKVVLPVSHGCTL